MPDDGGWKGAKPVEPQIAEVVASVLGDPKAVLNLGQHDVAFLVLANHVMRRDSLPDMDFDRLAEVYGSLRFYEPDQVPLSEMADTDLKVQRTIHRLAEMRLLLPSGTRTRSGGVAAAYRLGPIAAEIVSEYSFVEGSEAERLGFVFSRLRLMLSATYSEIRSRGAKWTKAQWDEQARDLSLIVHDLVRGVERRQRMLDRWHEGAKSRVKSMLRAAAAGSRRWTTVSA